jgi:hypothetical protein
MTYALTFTDTATGRSTTVRVRSAGQTADGCARACIAAACAALGVTSPARLRMSGVMMPRQLNAAEARAVSRAMTGFMVTMTPDQRTAALAYRGPDTHGVQMIRGGGAIVPGL